MSIFAELADDILDFLKKAGHAVETFVVTEAQKAVIYLKQNEPLVTKTLNIISDLESSSLPGADRMNKLLSDIADEAATIAAEGGFSGLLARGVSDLRQFGQSVFDDFKADIAKL